MCIFTQSNKFYLNQSAKMQEKFDFLQELKVDCSTTNRFLGIFQDTLIYVESLSAVNVPA